MHKIKHNCSLILTKITLAKCMCECYNIMYEKLNAMIKSAFIKGRISESLRWCEADIRG